MIALYYLSYIPKVNKFYYLSGVILKLFVMHVKFIESKSLKRKSTAQSRSQRDQELKNA